jgi:hypothetical protein
MTAADVITSADQARAIAEEMLDVKVRPALDLEVVTTSVREFETCWVVGYQSRAYVETGEASNALAGGGPIIINRRSGAARMGTSSLAAEAQLDPD